MPWTIEDALDDKLLKNVQVDGNRYSFQIGELPQTVTVELATRRKHGMIWWKQSHVINTPVQAGAYRTSRPSGDYEAYALHLAISGLTSYYKQAVKEGHKPEPNWLEPY